MMKKISRSMSIQKRLITLFLSTSLIIAAVNIAIIANIRYAFSQIDNIYMSNVEINDLSSSLDNVQSSLTDYLNTKSTESLENFYKYSQSYSEKLGEFSRDIRASEVLIMEKNICSLSDTYLDAANSAVNAKRSRNIVQYKKSYDQACELDQYINTFIYSLNNVQFKSNAADYHVLYSIFEKLEIIAMLILLAVIILSLVITVTTTRSITAPLKQLANYADEISGGNFDVPPLDIDSGDEISTVSDAFNKMVVSIRGYIEKIKTSMETERLLREKELLTDAHLKEAELKYLQAQINPHFLFNTLNAGAQLAMMENADTTYRYLQNVASFFRNKTNREKQITTLADEIALVDNYIYIINVRFSGSIFYEKLIDDELTGISVPSMILQPIIENAINHGVRDIDWEAHITLSVYRTGSDICISIKDNGRGMTQEQIDALISGSEPVHVKGDETNGVGLNNVISRLRMFYNRDEVFDVTSPGVDKGTEVILYLPAPEDPDSVIK